MDRPPQDKSPPTADGAKKSGRLERMLRRSAVALLMERVWRVAVAVATLALFFLALSWLGLWREAGVEFRMTGVALFGAAAVFVIAREFALGWPRRRAALARLDADAPLRPASSLDDTLAGRDPDPATTELWALHRVRLEKALARTPITPPQPRLAERDPFALRALALVAAVAAAFVAGDEKRARLAAAFDWRTASLLGPAARVDAWLDPPPYTGRPPIVLAAEREGAPVEAPINAILHVRPASAGVATDGALTAVEAAPAKPDAPKAEPVKELSFKLGGAARLALPDGRRFDLVALPDKAPTIALTENPRNNTRGSMTLAFRTEDDYGVVSAEAVFSASTGRRTLYAPPRLALALPPGGGGLGEARATLDLADSPWAGAQATLRLVAKDAADNDAASEPIDVTLPQRRFTKPLARALVEQRRNLALDPEARANVRAALEALSLAPEAFDTPSSIHLGLRAARRGLEGTRDDDDLRSVVDMLWAMALSLEDGDLSQAERDLRAAERELREAMARGDSDEEIARRTEELRAALDKFLQQLGEQAARDRDRNPTRDGAGDNRALNQDDLQNMLDDMAKAMRSGDLAQAQKLLDDLQDVLENLQPSRDGAGARGREMSRALSEIDRLAREQQQLRDETFQGLKRPGDDDASRPSRNTRPSSGEPQPGDAASERDRQHGLRDRLERQQEALRRSGEDAGEDLDDARKAMKEAEEALGKSGEGRGKAVDAQGRALQALRQGADKLAAQMRGEGEDGAEGEEGQGKKPDGRGRIGEGRDPLGRASGANRGANTRNRYDPLGLPPAQRAHRVQEELRRRLGQPERPIEELDYLQRLLRR